MTFSFQRTGMTISRKFAAIMALGLMFGFAVVIVLQNLGERQRLLDQVRRSNIDQTGHRYQNFHAAEEGGRRCRRFLTVCQLFD